MGAVMMIVSCQTGEGIFPFPELGKFPIPAPSPSCLGLLDMSLILDQSTYADVDILLRQKLTGAGYYENQYFELPDGFAIITKLENIDVNKRPLKENHRWALGANEIGSSMVKNEISSFEEYKNALIMPNSGYCRFFVFYFSATPFSSVQNNFIPITTENFNDKFSFAGMNRLPVELGLRRVKNEHRIFVLVYEFIKKENQTPKFIKSSNYSANAHLNKSNLF